MANRAYLFSTNNSDFNPTNDHEKPYYDSRHNIPLLWFLFFTKDNIKIKTCWLDEDPNHEEDSWEQVILIENKEIAIAKFVENLKFLTKIWRKLESDKDVLNFIEKVRQWTGKNIILAPHEIVEDHPKAFRDFNQALEILSNKEPFKFIETLSDYSGEAVAPSFLAKLFPGFVDKFADEKVKDCPNYFIGYTYW